MPRFREILQHVRVSLKPGGRLLIAEPGPLPEEQTRAQQIARHHISSKFVAEEMAQAGFTILEQRERFAQIPEANWYSLVVGQRPSSEEERAAGLKNRVVVKLVRPPSQGALVEYHLFTANSVCQLSTTVKGSGAVCSTGMTPRNCLPSLVALASENQAAGVRNRNWGIPGRNVTPAVTATDINVPSGAL